MALNGRESNPDGVGARARLTLRDGPGAPARTLTRWLEAGSGYASQSQHSLHFGLGGSPSLEALEVTWPSGHVDRFDGDELAVDHHLRIVEGEGIVERRASLPTASGIPLRDDPAASETSTTDSTILAQRGTDASRATPPSTES